MKRALPLAALTSIACLPALASASYELYSFTGVVTALGDTGSIAGVQGSLGQAVSGTFGIDQSQSFITAPIGTLPSGLMGAPGTLTVQLGADTFTSTVYQTLVAQQSPAGVNVVQLYSVGFNFSLNGNPVFNPVRGGQLLSFAFPGLPFPNGPLSGLANPDLIDPNSYGLLYEADGSSNTITFAFKSFEAQSVPAPASTGVMGLVLLSASRRRR